MKLKSKAKEYLLSVTIKTTYGEAIDERELDRFARIFLRGFLKPKLIKKKVIEYTGPIGISLSERLRKPITKRDFLFIIEQVVVAVQKLQANKLPLHNLLMDVNSVFINEVTKEVQFIYLPLSSGQSDSNLVEFIESIVYSLRPADEKDNEFASHFIHFFKAMQPFDISKIEKYVANEDKNVVSTIKKQNVGQSGFMTDKQKHYQEHYNENNGGDEPTGLLDDGGDEPTGLLDDGGDEPTDLLDDGNEATGLLNPEDEDEATGLLRDDVDEATGLLNPEDEDEATGLLSQNNASVRFPTLYRLQTEETVSINKPVFRLGKERSYVDYFVTNNVAVSRSHADIITRGTNYYVIDLNSKNHTYINDVELPIQVETEIRDGDRLRLGNEEFIFNT